MSQSIKAYSSTVHKLMRFSSLQPGWHLHAGQAISRAALQDAEQILGAGHRIGFSASDTFPGPDGNVMISFYEGPEQYIQVTVEGAHCFELLYEVNDQELIRRELATIDEVASLLTQIYGEICRNRFASPLMSQITLTTIGTGSWISHSNPRPMGAEYHVLAKSAQSGVVGPFVATYKGSTPQLLGHRGHSGDSTPTRYLTAQAS